jgi:DNA-binding MarR family transcriptional regulator
MTPSEPSPFDVVEASRRVWLGRWSEDAASGMAAYTAILRSHQLLREQVDVVMRRHDLTFVRHQVLAWLATDPEPSLTLSWISRTLRMPPATLTNVVDHLEAKGLVRRQTHPTDGRTTLAVITEAGRRLEAEVTAELNAEVYERIPLGDVERAELTALLRELRSRAQEFDPERSAEVIAGLDGRADGGTDGA